MDKKKIIHFWQIYLIIMVDNEDIILRQMIPIIDSIYAQKYDTKCKICGTIQYRCGYCLDHYKVNIINCRQNIKRLMSSFTIDMQKDLLKSIIENGFIKQIIMYGCNVFINLWLNY